MDTLATLARHLNLAARRRAPQHYRGPRRHLPALWLVTDEKRLADPRPAAARLPRGAGILFRHYGDPARGRLGRELWAIARERHLILIVAVDEHTSDMDLASHGIHYPERLLSRPLLHAFSPRVLKTGSVHSARALKHAAQANLDAVFLSPVFPTRSHPETPPLGPLRFAGLVRSVDLPVYALGGVSKHNATRLRGSGAAGLAAIAALSRQST